MKLYETTFIINPQTDDATINRYVQEVSDLITGNDGKIVREDHMGTRRLAYEINGLTQGYYASFLFEAPTSVLPKLDRHYKLNESYIRNLTVRFEGDPDKISGQDDVFGRPVQDDAKDNDESPADRKSDRPARSHNYSDDDNSDDDSSDESEQKSNNDSEL